MEKCQKINSGVISEEVPGRIFGDIVEGSPV